MGLEIYSAPNETSQLASENPFTITFDGRIGGAQDKLIYIHNNDSDLWYSVITLTIIDTIGINIVDGSRNGWTWKLMEKDIPPMSVEWDTVVAGNILSLSNIGSELLSDVVSYIPIWVRVTIPRAQQIQNITDVVLRINAQEHLI